MRVEVVRVFVDERGNHGNELGLVVASAWTQGREQALAARLGLSETVVVDVEPAAPDRRAAMRLFTPSVELPFAGHPAVGAAWWLARRGSPALVLAVRAGDVEVRREGDLTLVAARPEWGPVFSWLQLPGPEAVTALRATSFTEGVHYAWAWEDEGRGVVRSRMFAPALGVGEDEATGSAAVRLSALLGRDLEIRQGGGSRLSTRLLDDGRVLLGGRVAAANPVDVEL